MTSSLTTRLHGNYLFSAEIKTFEMPAQKQQRGIYHNLLEGETPC